MARPLKLVTAAAVLAAALASASATTSASGQATAGTVKIGISLSLSGDFSDSGKAAMRGYNLWRDVVNAHGGLLGNPVKLKILDDTSSPTQVVTNYQNLITKDKVQFVFGPFSTLLTAPAATVAKYAAKKPDLVVGGTQNNDAYAQIKALIQLKFSPKFLFFSNGPNDPAEFPSKVGPKNVNGIFSSGDWFPESKAPGNKAFVAAYAKKYGKGPIDPTSPEAFAAGQVLQLAVAKTHSLDNGKIITALHKGSWPTVEGVLRWNSIGEPQGQDLLVEWVNGKLYPVYPPKVALHAPMQPKPPWGG